MDFKHALEYILSFADFERAPRSSVIFDLNRITALLARIGNPELAARTVHITGTKGKGSTSAMIASILTDAGYRTGLYTSPHLLSVTERIQVDGRPISEPTFATLAERLQPDIAAINREARLGQVTTFEILTAMAFLHYCDIRADYQVMEVGLGGRLDATNVVKPEVCVITSISYDHMEVLGHTLPEIAYEKAGIIKPGADVVSAPQSPEAMLVIERTCREKGSRLIKVGQDLTWRRTGFDPEGQTFDLKGLTGEYRGLRIPLLGEYQMENAAASVAAAELLRGRGAVISEENIRMGLAEVNWPGRLQVLRRKPWLVIDGAHNAYSCKRLTEALRGYFSFDRLILVYGASGDKHISGMVEELAPKVDEVIIATANHPRAAKAQLLIEEFAKHGVKAADAGDVPSAVALAFSHAGPRDLVCAAGSIFMIAEVIECVSRNRPR